MFSKTRLYLSFRHQLFINTYEQNKHLLLILINHLNKDRNRNVFYSTFDVLNIILCLFQWNFSHSGSSEMSWWPSSLPRKCLQTIWWGTIYFRGRMISSRSNKESILKALSPWTFYNILRIYNTGGGWLHSCFRG